METKGEGTFTVEAWRGDVVESRHHIHAVITDSSGVVEAWGDRQRATIPRSAIKSIQALPLLTSGAADAYGMSEEELALACASHSGEPEHVEAVRAWLDRLDLSDLDLECGADIPLGKEAKREFLASRGEPNPVFNCCSGKHAGFLTLARHLDLPTAGYVERCSEVQRHITHAIETMTGLDLSEQRSGIDGCGIPVFALPLQRMALAMARLVDPVDLDPDLAAATTRVSAAAQRTFWVSGTGRTENVVEGLITEPVVMKAGAEGVFMAALPAQRLGIALKAADGTARASHAAIKGLLHRLGALPAVDADGGSAQPILNKAGTYAGELRPVISAPVHASI